MQTSRREGRALRASKFAIGFTFGHSRRGLLKRSRVRVGRFGVIAQ